jgi:hypothetical protein
MTTSEESSSAAGASGSTGASASYEFAADENEVILRTSRALAVLGILTLAGAVAAAFARSWAVMALAVLSGALIVVSAKAFGKIVSTKGDDVAHLMAALRSIGAVLFARTLLFVLAVAAAVYEYVRVFHPF